MAKKVRYSYCIDENGDLVHVSSLTNESRHASRWYCLQCGQEMDPKLGPKKTKHFAHKADTACDGESYLHKLAKRIIRERFLSTNSFPIFFHREVHCNEGKKCPYFDSYNCQETQTIPIELKQWYDTCKEEVTIGEFRPDLLLTCSSKTEREPVFIEIFKTHQSAESKLMSNYRIIETKKIETEEDIADITNRGFVEGENCTAYNFKPKLSKKVLSNNCIERFILFPNGAARKEIVNCAKMHQKINTKSLAELNIRDRNFEAWANGMNLFQVGLAYLLKKGFSFRNCMICKKYRYNDFYGMHICILYKKIHLESFKPKQSQAINCPYFDINSWLTNIPLSELEKYVIEELFRI